MYLLGLKMQNTSKPRAAFVTSKNLGGANAAKTDCEGDADEGQGLTANQIKEINHFTFPPLKYLHIGFPLPEDGRACRRPDKNARRTPGIADAWCGHNSPAG